MHPSPAAHPLRLAAPGPVDTEADSHDDGPSVAWAHGPDTALHEQCEQLAAWALSRRYWSEQRAPVSLLGTLGKQSPRRLGAWSPECSAEMMALWTAFRAQPEDALDTRVFIAHYLVRVRSIKGAAARLGIGRQHWYTLLRDFRRRIHAAAACILSDNLQALHDMQSRRVSRSATDDMGSLID